MSLSADHPFNELEFELLPVRCWQIKMQFLYLQFKHPNIFVTLDELSKLNFILGSIN